MEITLRTLRILFAAVLFTMVLDPLMAEWLLRGRSNERNSLFFACFGVVGGMNVLIAVFAQVKMAQPAVEILQAKPDDPAALGKFRTAGILSYVMLESVMLLGFALRFTRGTLQQALPFYMVAIGLMILWWPRRP